MLSRTCWRILGRHRTCVKVANISKKSEAADGQKNGCFLAASKIARGIAPFKAGVVIGSFAASESTFTPSIMLGCKELVVKLGRAIMSAESVKPGSTESISIFPGAR